MVCMRVPARARTHTHSHSHSHTYTEGIFQDDIISLILCHCNSHIIVMPPENSNDLIIIFHSRMNLIVRFSPLCYRQLLLTFALSERPPYLTALQMEVCLCVKFRTNSGLRGKFKPNCVMSAFSVDVERRCAKCCR